MSIRKCTKPSIFLFLCVLMLVVVGTVKADIFVPPVVPEIFEPSIDFSKLELVTIPQVSHTAGDVEFNMRRIPAATFPLDVVNGSTEITVEHDVWMAETVVTYDLWYEVRSWAIDNGYSFANAGREGSHGSSGQAPTEKKNEPVTMINWRDCVVWCNALSEYLDHEPVYRYHHLDGTSSVIRDATRFVDTLQDKTVCDYAVQEDRNGFRLPTSDEWVLAARYINGEYWTPEFWASGAQDATSNNEKTQEVAWYIDNSKGKTQNVGMKRSNQLKLYDMSGNVWEWCFTQHLSILSRWNHGGSYLDEAGYMMVRSRKSNAPSHTTNTLGFRLARTPSPEPLTTPALTVPKLPPLPPIKK